MFISLIYLTNWLYLRSTDAEGYGNNKGVAPTGLNSNAWDGMINMHGQQVRISKINNDHLKALFLYLPMQTEETYQGNQYLI
jgi:hypothetical protein